jgi:hypothetical protein
MPFAPFDGATSLVCHVVVDPSWLSPLSMTFDRVESSDFGNVLPNEWHYRRPDDVLSFSWWLWIQLN